MFLNICSQTRGRPCQSHESEALHSWRGGARGGAHTRKAPLQRGHTGFPHPSLRLSLRKWKAFYFSTFSIRMVRVFSKCDSQSVLPRPATSASQRILFNAQWARDVASCYHAWSHGFETQHCINLGVVEDFFFPNSWEVKAGRSKIQGHLQLLGLHETLWSSRKFCWCLTMCDSFGFQLSPLFNKNNVTT